MTAKNFGMTPNFDKHAFLMHGLFGKSMGFSLGIDALADKLTREGIRTSIYEYTNYAKVAKDIELAAYKGCKIILGGHSLGANWSTRIAAAQLSNIPIPLLVSIDPTVTTIFERVKPIGNNVGIALNWYNTTASLCGHARLTHIDGYHGKLVNTGIALDHVAMDDDKDIHDTVLRYAREL